MEHYYVVTGNEYGFDIGSKENFDNIHDGLDHFNKVKVDDFGCAFMYVNEEGVETILRSSMEYGEVAGIQNEVPSIEDELNQLT